MVECYKRHVTLFEKIAAVTFWIFAISAIVVQLFYGGGAEMFTAIIVAFTVLFTYMVFGPVTYELREDELAVIMPIVNYRKENLISYNVMINCDTVGSFFLSKRDLDAVEVIITYRPTGSNRNRTISCHPKNVQDFVKRLNEKCPHLIDT